MSVFVKIEKGKYIDSLETLYASSVLMDQEGIVTGFVGVGTAPFKDTVISSGLNSTDLDSATGNDLVIIRVHQSSGTEAPGNQSVLRVRPRRVCLWGGKKGTERRAALRGVLQQCSPGAGAGNEAAGPGEGTAVHGAGLWRCQYQRRGSGAVLHQ